MCDDVNSLQWGKCEIIFEPDFLSVQVSNDSTGEMEDEVEDDAVVDCGCGARIPSRRQTSNKRWTP